MVRNIYLVEKVFMYCRYEITQNAWPSLRGCRSIDVSANIKSGKAFTDFNIKYVRSSFGLRTKHYKEIIGRHAVLNL